MNGRLIVRLLPVHPDYIDPFERVTAKGLHDELEWLEHKAARQGYPYFIQPLDRQPRRDQPFSFGEVESG